MRGLCLVVIAATACASGQPPAPFPPRHAVSFPRATLAPRAGARQERYSKPLALPLLSRVLYLLRENYIDRSRFNWSAAIMGALEFVQRDTQEVFFAFSDVKGRPLSVTARVNGQTHMFLLADVDAVWNLRSKLEDILGFVAASLRTTSAPELALRTFDLDFAASNGVLYSLDPHSVLLDAETSRSTYAPADEGKRASVGLNIGFDALEQIVVRAVAPGSPAAIAGLTARDRIVEIDGESAAHMDLDTVIDRLRGAIGSRMDLLIERVGWKTARRVTVVRNVVGYSSLRAPAEILEARSGPDGASPKVGYVALAAFGSDATERVRESLRRFKAEEVRGVILDLRDNGGGLYDQARKVVDLFARSGTIVSMVGDRGRRKDEIALDDGYEPSCPVAVLVNAGSAAGSEIVAEALRGLDRAIIVGEPTFGDGSVQVLFDVEAPLDATGPGGRLALKLTSAQWLTPTDTSIQGTGTIPDIEIVPLRVGELGGRPALVLDRQKSGREADYERYLQRPAPQATPPQPELVPYLAEPRVEGADARAEDDFALNLARDLLGRSPGESRREVLGAAAAVLERRRGAEDAKLVAALAKRGIDWSAGAPSSVRSPVRLEVEIVGGERTFAPGDVVTIRGAVTNQGTSMLARVRAVFEGSAPFIDGKTLAFGKVAPGETRRAEMAVAVPRDRLDATYGLRATIGSASAYAREPARATFTVRSPARPFFDVTYESIPGGAGADPAKPERAKLRVDVKNTGVGPSSTLRASLHAAAGQVPVPLVASRFSASDLAPGAESRFTFVYELAAARRRQPLAFQLRLYDASLEEGVVAQIQVPQPSQGVVKAPRLNLAGPTIASAFHTRVEGVADAPDELTDLFVLVRSNQTKARPRKIDCLGSQAGGTHVPFTVEVPLESGANTVEVRARDRKGAQAFVRRVIFNTR